MNLSIIFILTIYFIFLQDLTIKVGSQQFYICSIIVFISLFFILYKKYKEFFYKIFQSIKQTPIKYLILYIIWVFVTAFFCGGIGTSLKIIFRSFLIWGLVVIPTIFFTIYLIPRYISFKKCLKIFLVMYQFIMYYGIFDFIARILNIYPLRILHNFICSRSILQSGGSLFVPNALIRATSIFFEPSFFATFIFIFLPLSYVFFTSKVQLYKNKKIDKLIKINLIIITWIALLLTMSPMYIVLCLLYTVFFFWRKIFKSIISKKGLIFCFVTSIILSFFISVFDIDIINAENKVTSRIVKTVCSFGNLDKLVENEASLATRLITSANTFIAAKKHPIKGVGFGNDHDIMYAQYVSTDLPLTWEIQLRAVIEDGAGSASNIFFALLLQTGWVGILLIYAFFVQSILQGNKISLYFQNSDYLLLKILYFIALNYLIISFYWGYVTYPIMWFVFGLLNSFILYYKTVIRKQQLFLKNNQNLLEDR